MTPEARALDTLRLLRNAARRPCTSPRTACDPTDSYVCPAHQPAVRIAVRRLRGNQLT